MMADDTETLSYLQQQGVDMASVEPNASLDQPAEAPTTQDQLSNIINLLGAWGTTLAGEIMGRSVTTPSGAIVGSTKAGTAVARPRTVVSSIGISGQSLTIIIVVVGIVIALVLFVRK